jgi:hypothetical protein
MKFCLSLVASFMALSSIIAAPVTNPIKRTVELQVLDSTSGEALTGVQVTVEGLEEVIWTDDNGKLTIEVSSIANSILTCSLVSFETRSLELTELEESSIIYLSEK